MKSLVPGTIEPADLEVGIVMRLPLMNVALMPSAAQVPRPPRKDFYKLMNRDRIVLRFAVRLVAAPGCPLSETDRWAALNPSPTSTKSVPEA